MTQTFWCSTPTWTCLVIVERDSAREGQPVDRIVFTAPILWQAWIRRPWQSFHRAQIRRWGVAYQAVPLPESVALSREPQGGSDRKRKA